MQIVHGLPDPATQSFPYLQYALKGVRRNHKPNTKASRLPITPEILRKIHQNWSNEPPDFNHTMLWAAFCLAFFGFMRAGELTCPSHKEFRPFMLAPDDIAVDSHTSPTYLTVRLKQSKTDPFGAGVTLHLGTTGDILCPVRAVLGYLAIRHSMSGPLFLFEDGVTFSRVRLVQSLRHVLSATGVNVAQFSGHSFRIGAATTAARAGLSEALIKTLGKWRSSAYSVYIRTPGQQLAAVSATLCT